jgi:hypothetical protein
MTERTTIANELKALNSSLSGQAPRMPYTLPEGYFDGLTEQVLGRVRREAVEQELAVLAPGLVGKSRQIPYASPTGYFDQVQIPATESAPVLPLFRRSWVRYASAVAAVLIGLLVWLNRDTNTGQNPDAAAVVIQYQEDINKMDEAQKQRLQDFVEAGMTGEETAQLENRPALQASLLTDVSEQELTEFLEQSEPLTSSTQIND